MDPGERKSRSGKPVARRDSGRTLAVARIDFAMRALAESGVLSGARSRRLSARIDPGLLQAAKRKSGIENESELVAAALAALAGADDFGPWFAAQAGRLPKDFALDF